MSFPQGLTWESVSQEGLKTIILLETYFQGQPWPGKMTRLPAALGGGLGTRQAVKETEHIQRGLGTEFWKQTKLDFSFAIFGSIEIFQHASLRDKMFKRGEEIGLWCNNSNCAQISCKQGKILSAEWLCSWGFQGKAALKEEGGKEQRESDEGPFPSWPGESCQPFVGTLTPLEDKPHCWKDLQVLPGQQHCNWLKYK